MKKTMSKYRKAHKTDIYAYIISAHTYKHMAGIKIFFKKSKKLFAKSCCKYHTIIFPYHDKIKLKNKCKQKRVCGIIKKEVEKWQR